MAVSKTRVVLWALLWLAGLSFGGAAVGLNGWPWRFSLLEPYVYSHNGWHHGAFTIESLRATPPESQRFVLIGGSACLEAITSDADAEARLRELTDIRAEFSSVCSSYTTFSDIAKIVDRIGPNGGTILLLLEPGSFGKGQDIQLDHRVRSTGKLLPKYYFLPIPDRIKTILQEQGIGIPFAYDTLSYIKGAPGQFVMAARQGLTARVNGKLEYQRHLLTQRADEDKIVAAVHSLKSIPDENIAMNIALLRGIIEIAQGHGNSVTIVNHPNAEPYRAEIATGLPSYDRIITDLVDEYGVGHIDLRYSASWPRDDFWDSHHMTPQGREKFTRLLIERLASHAPTWVAQ